MPPPDTPPTGTEALGPPSGHARRIGHRPPEAQPPLIASVEPAWFARLQRRAATWRPTTRGMLWTTASGLLFTLLNTLMRALAQSVDPMQAQFLRYAMGLLILLPLVLWHGPMKYRPKDVVGQFWRGGMHSVGLLLWFLALPRIPLADMTAIGFTSPIFIIIGARLFFGEPMHWERWVATALGFVGVLIVVGPRLSFAAGAGSSGIWHLVMLASAPMFAASFLITKALTRHESAGVILVWQSITVSLFSLPLALWHWGPLSAAQWSGFVLCGVLGSAGHYCLTRSFAAADISATQSVKFLDLVWAALLGLVIFGDLPNETTLLGGSVIAAATLWVARREGQRARQRRAPDAAEAAP